jgi:hypothetical protein
VLSVADALPSEIQDPDLAGGRAASPPSPPSSFFNSIERDALYTAFGAKKFAPGTLAAVASTFGGREQREPSSCAPPRTTTGSSIRN